MSNLVRIEHFPETAPELASPRAERIIDGNPVSKSWDMEASPDGKATCGVWEVEPGAWNVVKDAWEVMTIISGRSTLTEDGGEPVELVPGVTVVMRAGFRGVWRVYEPTRKVWAIYEA